MNPAELEAEYQKAVAALQRMTVIGSDVFYKADIDLINEISGKMMRLRSRITTLKEKDLFK